MQYGAFLPVFAGTGMNTNRKTSIEYPRKPSELILPCTLAAPIEGLMKEPNAADIQPFARGIQKLNPLPIQLSI